MHSLLILLLWSLSFSLYSLMGWAAEEPLPVLSSGSCAEILNSVNVQAGQFQVHVNHVLVTDYPFQSVVNSLNISEDLLQQMKERKRSIRPIVFATQPKVINSAPV